MATLRPFRALRPNADNAARIAAVPYDVVSTDEARALAVRAEESVVTAKATEIANRNKNVAVIAATQRAQEEAVGITVAATYDAARLTGRDADALLAQAKDLYGGRRPAGSDVVYVLTDRDIVTEAVTGGQLAGLADCIGGIRNPRRAFAVGEVGSVSAPGVPDGTAKTMAHEVGHLIGNYHTDNANDQHSLMDAGGTGFGNLFGVGPDNIGGTADDADVDFALDTFIPSEGFTGKENTLNVSAWAYTAAK